jgi:hypothetical protein
MNQPRQRIRLRAHILPTLQYVLELTAIPSTTEHEYLTASVFEWAKPGDVELAGVSHPRGAVDGAMGSHAPPQADVPLAG